MKPTVYIVFDQLPKKEDGGLIATYINFVQQFKNEFEIKIISVFNNGGNDIEAFDDIEIINLSNYILDNRFFLCLKYLKAGQFKRFFHAIASGIVFFCSIPFMRYRTAQLLKDEIIIATAPAAAMFLSKKIRFILEIHINYEYFWGENRLGKLQIALASKPALTLFRNRTDAKKARHSFPSDYIYNGIIEPHTFGGERASRTPHSALFVGRLSKQKNPLFLLRCAQRVQEKIQDFTLDIYGSGELEQDIKDEIVRLHLEDIVRLKGFTEDKTVYSQYEQFWLSSDFEGFGLVLVEAMANSTPVITTNWGDAVFEIIKEGQTGLIANNEIDFANKSISLFCNPAEQERLAKNARQDYLDRFTVEQNKKRWTEIITSVF